MAWFVFEEEVRLSLLEIEFSKLNDELWRKVHSAVDDSTFSFDGKVAIQHLQEISTDWKWNRGEKSTFGHHVNIEHRHYYLVFDLRHRVPVPAYFLEDMRSNKLLTPGPVKAITSLLGVETTESIPIVSDYPTLVEFVEGTVQIWEKFRIQYEKKLTQKNPPSTT